MYKQSLYRQPLKNIAAIVCLFFSAITTAESLENEFQSPLSYDKDIFPFLDLYCTDCHSEDEQEGNMNFEALSNVGALHDERKDWRKAFKQLAIGAMPPADEMQPSDEEREKIAFWLNERLNYVDTTKPIDPGHVTARLMNRSEYNNTIRDLFGVHIPFADEFPDDNVGYGFDNIGDVHSVSPLRIEAYLNAAEKLTDVLYKTGKEQLFQRGTFAGFFDRQGKVEGSVAGVALWPKAEISMDITLPVAGEYQMAVKTWGSLPSSVFTKAGKSADKTWPLPEGVSLEGQEDQHIWLVARANNQTLGMEKIDLGVPREQTQYLTLNFQAEAGTNVIAVKFLTPDQTKALSLDAEQLAHWKKDPPRLNISWIEVKGPHAARAKKLSPLHEKLLTVKTDKKYSFNKSAQSIIEPIASAAFRRPVSKRELKKLLKFSKKIYKRNNNDFDQAMARTIEAILISPHFLYRLELGPGANNPEWIRPVGDYALASRLSYFLWSSMPDDELMGLAKQGKLSEKAILASQVSRMLEDPKANAFTERFFSQWLDLRKLPGINIDKKTFPEFSSLLKADLEKETMLFISSIVEDNASILDLLGADYTFANERLAKFYGLPEIKGEKFRKVSLENIPRRGLLTQGSILMLTSYPNRTSPTKRGNWILEAVLGDEPPDPPADAPALEEIKEDGKEISIREHLEVHRTNKACASCHATMDVIGLGLENFDAIGQWRDKDGSFEIDASGALPTGETFAQPIELLDILMTRKEDFSRCFTEKLMTFALGRGLEYYDRIAVDKVLAENEQNGYLIKDILKSVVMSRPFLYARSN